MLKRWFLHRLALDEFGFPPAVLGVYDHNPWFRAWYLTKWAKLTGRPYRYYTESKQERRRSRERWHP